MFETIFDTIVSHAGDPLIVGLLLVAATFILEDPATVGGALIAADGIIHPFGALFALYVGIVLGDLGLYGLGWLGARNRRVQSFLERRRIARAGDWMRERLIGTIVASRFVPGMRLPVYTACGLFGLSFGRFCLTVLLAVAIWTTALFYAVYLFGATVLDGLGPWRWAAGAVLVLLVIVLPRIIRRMARRDAFPEVERPE